MINETLRKLRNAASTGKSCGGCGRDFQPNEPVWRMGYLGPSGMGAMARVAPPAMGS
jgi:hypothetical protein